MDVDDTRIAQDELRNDEQKEDALADNKFQKAIGAWRSMPYREPHFVANVLTTQY